MTVRSKTLWPTMIGGVAFLVLFPGFFFYHLGAGQGLYGLFMGGGFRESVIALWVPLLLAALTLCVRESQLARSRGTIVFMTLVAWSLAWLGLNAAISPAHPGHFQLAATIVSWVALFCLGLSLPLESVGFRRVVWAAWLAMGVAALLTTDARQLQAVGQVTDGVATYQQLARSVMVVCAVVVAYTSDIRMRGAFAAFSVLVLFVIGARSEFYGFVAGYALVEYLINRKSIIGRIILSVGAVSAVALIVQYMDILQSSRQLEILNLSESSSWTARDYFHQQAREQIYENPLFGEYAGHWIFGEGNYSHDILSAWVSLGLPGFLLYLAINVGCTACSVRILFSDPRSSLVRLAALMNVATLMLVFLAKPVYWELPPLAWALAIVCVVDFKSRRGQSPRRKAVRKGLRRSAAGIVPAPKA